jgi:hypothetical protein
MSNMVYIKMYLTRILLVVGCLAALASWYFISPQVDSVYSAFSLWNRYISTFTLFIGIFSIGARYINNIRVRGPLWTYHAYAIVVIVLWIIMGEMTTIYSSFYQVAYVSTKVALHIASLGLMIFFMVSGGYRVLRVKNMRTAIFAISTGLICAFNAPWISYPFPTVGVIKEWLLNYPSMGGYRGLVFAGSIGAVILGIRILLGLEKGSLRITQEA